MVKVGNFQDGEQKHVMPLQARTQNSNTATFANMPSDRTIHNQAQCQWGERGNPLVSGDNWPNSNYICYQHGKHAEIFARAIETEYPDAASQRP